jgi:hypothetical protein
MPERLASFRGEVQCERAARVPGLILRGNTLEAPAEPTALAFSGYAPPDLPATLADAVIEHVAGAQYRISAPAGSWEISASAVHLHREIAAQFYAAIPPRRASWTKRLFWRVVLGLGASRAGLALLKALRR